MRIAEITESGWRKFVPRSSGECVLMRASGHVSARWELGELVTGRSGVFAQHYVRIALVEGTDECLGFHSASLRRALLGALETARMAGFILDVAGAHPQFRERGLTWNSGWGEIDGKRLHMMDALYAYGLSTGTAADDDARGCAS